MLPRCANSRERVTTEVEVPRCLLRLPSVASVALVALSSSLRYTESRRGSPSSVARSATACNFALIGQFRSWIGSGPTSKRPQPAGCGLPRRSMARATARSPRASGLIRFTAWCMRRWSARSLTGCNSIISVASVDVAGRITWSLSRRPRISAGDMASQASTPGRPTARKDTRTMRPTRSLGIAAGATVGLALRSHGGSTQPSAFDRAAWAQIAESAKVGRLVAV